MLALDFPLSTIKKIFPEKKGEIFNKEHSLTKAKYTDKGLHSVFTELFYKHRDRLRIRDKEKVKMVTDLTMGHIIQRCAVTAYDYKTCQPHWFSSYEKGISGITVMDALLSTSAAPTYFPIHKFIYKEQKYNCIDGGVWGNDPSVYGLFKERIRNSFDRFRTYNVIAIVTGHQSFTDTKKPLLKLELENTLGWALGKPSIIDILMTASSSVVESMSKMISKTGVVFVVKLQIKLKKEMELDDDIHSIDDQQKYLAEPSKEFLIDLHGAVNLTMMMGINIEKRNK